MLIGGEEEFEGMEIDSIRESRQFNADHHNEAVLQLHLDTVSTLHKCQTVNAMKLCIFDLEYKLKHSSDYDIGGTYSESEPELWFYYTTSTCPGYNYLLNLFVCHRKIGNFSIGISDSNELTHRKMPNDFTGRSILPDTLKWYNFKSQKPNENYFIKTFCFTEKDIKSIENNAVLVPIMIETKPTHFLDMNIIKRIKLEHDFGKLLSKQEKTDFVLVSSNQKEFHAHKIILAAHSPVLRDIIKQTTSPTVSIDISDNDMDLLLQFIYTGTIKDILKQDSFKLLRIAEQFQLKSLFLLTELVLGEQITVKNAVEIATVSEKYKLEQLQTKVFNFIKGYPEVMDTAGWNNLKDINLTKKLLQHIHMHREH